MMPLGICVKACPGRGVALGLLLLTMSVSAVDAIAQSSSPRAPEVVGRLKCNQDPRVTLGLVSREICEGADLFFREPFDGNGRNCGTCHPANNNFTIDPAFIATLPPTDPLFVAEQVPALVQLEIPTLMRNFGLILENVDGLDAPGRKFVKRSVPHTFSLATSITRAAGDGTTNPPNERTGWSGDGAPNAGELRDFQTGAIIQHYTKSLARIEKTDFRLAKQKELDDI